MSINIQITELSEPLLEFAGARPYADPKVGLVREGPLSLRYVGGQPQQVRVGLVGPPEAIESATRWFDRCQHRILSTKTNRQRFPDYPGFNAIFRTSLELADRWTVELEQARDHDRRPYVRERCAALLKIADGAAP